MRIITTTFLIPILASMSGCGDSTTQSGPVENRSTVGADDTKKIQKAGVNTGEAITNIQQAGVTNGADESTRATKQVREKEITFQPAVQKVEVNKHIRHQGKDVKGPVKKNMGDFIGNLEAHGVERKKVITRSPIVITEFVNKKYKTAIKTKTDEKTISKIISGLVSARFTTSKTSIDECKQFAKKLVHLLPGTDEETLEEISQSIAFFLGAVRENFESKTSDKALFKKAMSIVEKTLPSREINNTGNLKNAINNPILDDFVAAVLDIFVRMAWPDSGITPNVGQEALGRIVDGKCKPSPIIDQAKRWVDAITLASGDRMFNDIFALILPIAIPAVYAVLSSPFIPEIARNLLSDFIATVTEAIENPGWGTLDNIFVEIYRDIERLGESDSPLIEELMNLIEQVAKNPPKFIIN